MKDTLEKKYNTREEWLNAAATIALEDYIDPAMADLGIPLLSSLYRISCGWPKGARGSTAAKVYGVCHPASHSSDEHVEMFISPILDDEAKAFMTVLHECIHQRLNCQDGHKGRFKRIALACGFEPPISKLAPSQELLEETMDFILPRLGEYPAAAMSSESPNKQSTRMLKLACSCGFTARTSRKWADQLQRVPGPNDGDDGYMCPVCLEATMELV